jgi:HK97 family phage prohead protease
MEFKQISLKDAQIKFSDEGVSSFSGYASVFNGNDFDNDTIHPGAFTKALETGTEIKMYYNHGWRSQQMPIGKMFVKQDHIGLYVERAEFTKGIKQADDVALAVKHGTIDGISIGFGIKSGDYKIKANGGRDIYQISLLKEISIVDYPADKNARILAVKSIEEAKTIREVEAALRDLGGIDRATSCLLVSRVKSLVQGELAAEAKAKAALEEVFNKFRV